MMTLTRPELTLPPAEARALAAAYAAASEILEYGSGGSTLLAAELPGKRITAVESDRGWAQMMRDWVADNPPAAGTRVEVVWNDIGPTRDWGHPVDETHWARFSGYPMGVWCRPAPVSPDVVLVDGRFRVGCALASAYLTEKPITLFVDDYVSREAYHKLQDYLGPADIIGRMARFEITPGPIPKADWLRITKFMYRP